MLCYATCEWIFVWTKKLFFFVCPLYIEIFEYGFLGVCMLCDSEEDKISHTRKKNGYTNVSQFWYIFFFHIFRKQRSSLVYMYIYVGSTNLIKFKISLTVELVFIIWIFIWVFYDRKLFFFRAKNHSKIYFNFYKTW